MKVAYFSNYREMSGYSNAAKGYIKALRTRDEIDLVVRNVQVIADGKMSEAYPEEEKNLQGVDISIFHTLPDFYCKTGAKKNVGFYAWETSKVPNKWVDIINTNMDAVVLFNQAEEQAAINCGVKTKTFTINHAFDASPEEDISNATIGSEITNEDTHVFYSIMNMGSRKNLHGLLLAYLREFREDDNVVLFLHASSSSEVEQGICNMIDSIKSGLKMNSYGRIMLNTKQLTDAEIERLHHTGDTYVSMSRGESWNIPLFKAISIGNTFVTPPNSGPLEYVEHDQCVVSNPTPVFGVVEAPHHMYSGEGLWEEPNVFSAGIRMRALYEAGKVRTKKKNLEFLADFSYEKIGKDILYMLEDILGA